MKLTFLENKTTEILLECIIDEDRVVIHVSRGAADNIKQDWNDGRLRALIAKKYSERDIMYIAGPNPHKAMLIMTTEL